LQRRRVLADTIAGPTMFNNVLAWRAEGVAATMQMQPTPGEQEQQAYVKPSFEAAYQNAVRLCWQGKK